MTRTTRATLERKLQERLPELMQLDLNTLFDGAATKLHGMTGRTAKGTWYLVFSLGLTNLGAVGETDMIIDFTHPGTELAALAGPGAIGYFIGFRIVQDYVAKYGSESWRDLFDMSVRDTLLKSGYNPQPSSP